MRQKQAPSLSIDQLRESIDSFPDPAHGVRNRAILGFTGAFRRSELAGLDINYSLIADAGMVIGLDSFAGGAQ